MGVSKKRGPRWFMLVSFCKPRIIFGNTHIVAVMIPLNANKHWLPMV